MLIIDSENKEVNMELIVSSLFVCASAALLVVSSLELQKKLRDIDKEPKKYIK